MKKKVLIIDDEEAFTEIAKLTLESGDRYEVCVENNPLTAVQTARNFMPDIIILDVVMPDMDGGEVRNQLMATPVLKNIPIIFLTAIVQEKDVAKNHGVIGGSFFLAKPASANVLIDAIEKHTRS